MIEKAESFIQATRAKIISGGDQSILQAVDRYHPKPIRERFTGTKTQINIESYYATSLHELTVLDRQ